MKTKRMSSDAVVKSKEAQKDYLWTKRLVTNVYSDRKSKRKRSKKGGKIAARLFVGEWTRRLKDVGEETHVRFRGGSGYVGRDDIGDERFLEIYFIDVGQGDSILIQTPDDKRLLIDGGKDESAYSFLRWKYNLKKHHKDFDAVIMTHGDEDHLGGLIHILADEHVLAKNIYHNGIARYKGGHLGKEARDRRGTMLVDLYDDIDDLTPRYKRLTDTYKDWFDAVSKAKTRAKKHGLDFKCCRVDQKTREIPIGGEDGVKIKFLGPINFGDSSSPRLKTYGSAGRTMNGNSVAVLLRYRKARILLCGDIHGAAERQFLRRWGEKTLQAHVFKASHHGSQDFTTDFLKTAKPWVTVVSSGDFPDYGHPRANLLGSLGHYAPAKIKKPILFSTEIAATFKRIEPKRGRKPRQLHEKTIHGLINVRTDGNWLAGGRVYSRTRKTSREGRPTRSLWYWEPYAFNLANGKPLGHKLLAR